MIEILERGSGKVFGMKVSGKILRRDCRALFRCWRS